MSEAGDALVLFGDATKAVRASNLIDKEDIEEFGTAAMRAIDAALKENNIYSAIDTMEKTKAIEDYLTYQVWHERVALASVNKAVAYRLKILRKIGEWLQDNLSTGRPPVENDGDVSIVSEKPKIYLSDIGITPDKSADWQQIARMPEEEFEEFVQPFIETPSDDRENLLTTNKVLTYLNPKPEPEPESDAQIALDAEMKELGLPSSGTKVYNLLKAVRRASIEYMNYLQENDSPLRHLYFMSTMFKSVGQGMIGAGATIDKWIGEKVHD